MKSSIGRDLLEDLLQAFAQEPIEGLPLDANEIGKRKHLVELGETDTFDGQGRAGQARQIPPRETRDARQKRVDGTANE